MIRAYKDNVIFKKIELRAMSLQVQSTKCKVQTALLPYLIMELIELLACFLIFSLIHTYTLIDYLFTYL